MTRTKGEKLEIVAERTAQLLLRHGIDGLSYAKLARASEVSRSWLYKYVGKERDDLLKFTADQLGAELAKFDARPRTDSRARWIEDSVAGFEGLLEASGRVPWVVPLYFRYLGSTTPIGEAIAAVDARYVSTTTEEIRTVFGFDEQEARRVAELLLATRMGIAHRQRAVGFAQERRAWLTERFQHWLETL